MNAFFGWISDEDSTTQACSKDERLALEEHLRNLTAKRKILNSKIDKTLLIIQQLEIEKARVSHLEDAIRDDLEKMPR